MVSRVIALAQRAALLAALTASAVLFVEYRADSAGGFCGPASGCAKVRESSFSSVAGIDLPVFGLVAFGALFLAALWAPPRRARLVALANGPVALGAVALIGLQLFQIGALCAWCLAADLGAIVAAAGALYLARRPAEEEPPPRRVLWSVLGVVAVAVPLSWQKPIEKVAALPQPVEQLLAPDRIDVVQFTDFECPFCRRMHAVLEEVRKDQRDVEVTRLMVPLAQHPGARPAALAYLCTPEPQREAMADALYKADALDPGTTEAFAQQIGVELEAYRKCVADPGTARTLDEHVALFKEAGLEGLPSSFVERQLIQGAREEELRTAIERARSGGDGMGTGWMFALLGVLFAASCAVSLRPVAEPEEAEGEASEA